MGLLRLPPVSRRAGSIGRAAVPAVAALAAGLGLAALTHSAGAADEKPAAGKKVDFAKDVQPILQQSCVRCHKAPDARGPGGPGGAPGGPPPAGGPGGPGGGRGGPRGPAGGLRLDDKASALKGGKHGKAIVPGKAEDSLMYKLLKGPTKQGNDEISAMPKAKPREEFKPLADDQIQTIKLWINQGAEWPAK
jgi:hypothetical protein